MAFAPRLSCALALSLALSACLPAAAPAQPRPERAFALLADGRVVAVSVATGAVLASRSIGARTPIATASPLLARHGDVLYALTPKRGGQELVLLGSTDLAVRARIALPADVAFGALAVARDGTAHLLGTRAGAPLLVGFDGARLGAPVELRPADGRDWMPIWAVLSSDDRRLAVSYHGRGTSGADIVDLATRQRQPCRPGPRGFGCLHSVHGAAAFADGTLVGTSGSALLSVYRRGETRLRTIETQLPRNHLMALARDPGTGAVVAAVTCPAARAVAVIDVARRSARAYRSACGDIVAAQDGLAVIGATVTRAPTGLSLLDIASGKRLRFIRTAPPVAVAL